MPKDLPRLIFTFASACALLACSGSSTELPSPDGSTNSEGGAIVPDPGPGSEVDVGFQNVGTNDTPEHATPLGTSTTGDVTVWITDNAIGGANDRSNYFVFRSGPTTGMFIFRGCFSSPLTGMTAALYLVIDGREARVPVATASSTPDGPTSACLTFDETVLSPNTVYLFELTATGGAGLYSL